MKNKMNMLLVPVLALVSVGFVFSSVSAKEAVAVKPEKTVEVQGVKGGSPNFQQTNAADAAVTTTTVTTTNTQVSQDESKKDKPKESKGQLNAEQHRNMVATFVKSLLAVADREGGIGQEVRVIAQQQNDTKDRAGDLITAVENRNKVKTFFIGTSYKNLGELRSQMVQTRNQIDQLKRLADKAENDQDKTELQTQIQTLEQQQTNINTFIANNESKFSLFGWAVKLFNK
ncbi:MAG TPA: hypothetical protein DEA43_02365 [Candidatus Moranbacteria bacterium]|nr:hypothetical protein [Candidatus Moranbacteria bacterium]HBT45709.1 hypothetical protein [Candidatus Moranbacteria bacterium]